MSHNSSFSYERDPKAIYARSFALIEEEARLDHLPTSIRPIAIRIIHACGMPLVAENLIASEDFVAVTAKRLRAGAAIYTDSEMTRQAIIRRRLPGDNPVRCTLNNAEVPQLARELATTRSAAAVNLWREGLAGSIVVIGNAPTALFALLEHLEGSGSDSASAPPAAIVAFPVGFVGAAEAKEALVNLARVQSESAIPYITLTGRLGGAAMAGAVINALGSDPPCPAA